VRGAHRLLTGRAEAGLADRGGGGVRGYANRALPAFRTEATDDDYPGAQGRRLSVARLRCSAMAEPRQSERFESGVERWRAGLDKVRDVVRQELVRRQIAGLLPGPPIQLEVLDVGCGQGTQALALARLRHRVVGIDLSVELLDQARSAADRDQARCELVPASSPVTCSTRRRACPGLRRRVLPRGGDVPALARWHRPGLGRRLPGGLVSLLTRNRAGLAMRAGMNGEWMAAVDAFDARYYENRLGIRTVRADEPDEVEAAFSAAGAARVAWYGVRLFTDHWDAVEPPDDLGQLLVAEEQAGRRDPYRGVAALTHTLARTADCTPALAADLIAPPGFPG